MPAWRNVRRAFTFNIFQKMFNSMNNTYKKYCPNVFVAQCEQKHEKGDIIEMTTKHGQTHEAIVFNLVGQNSTHFFYSIVRADGFNVQQWAKRRA